MAFFWTCSFYFTRGTRRIRVPKFGGANTENLFTTVQYAAMDAAQRQQGAPREVCALALPGCSNEVDGWSRVASEDTPRVNAYLRALPPMVNPSLVRIEKDGRQYCVCAYRCLKEMELSTFTELATMDGYADAYIELRDRAPVLVVRLCSVNEIAPGAATASYSATSGYVSLDSMLASGATECRSILEEARRAAAAK